MATYVSNRNGGTTDEQGHYRFQTKVWVGNVLSGLAAVQNSPLARNVLVPTGDLKIDYGQYSFTAWNDANVTVAIATADTTNPRIDRIIAYIDLAVALGTTNNPGVLKFIAVAGTPAGSPTKASDSAVNTAVGASNPWCEIATVRVEANATTIPNSKITDTRVLVTVGDNTVRTNSLQDASVTDGKIVTVSSNKVVGVCGFAAYMSSGWALNNGAIAAFNAERYDLGSNFDIATHVGRFTAPVNGTYSFKSIVNTTTSSSSTSGYLSLFKNGSQVIQGQKLNFGAFTDPGFMVEGDLQLVAGDYIEIYSNVGANMALVANGVANTFSGKLVST